MAKVILMAIVALLAGVRVAGDLWWPAAPQDERATLPPGVALAVGGGLAVQEFKPLFPAAAHDGALAPAFASLVSLNRLDSVERLLGGRLALERAEHEAEASWRAAGSLGPAQEQASEWRWDRVAALNTPPSAVAPPPRHWRQSRARKFWPLRRPFHGARVWLARKQP